MSNETEIRKSILDDMIDYACKTCVFYDLKSKCYPKTCTGNTGCRIREDLAKVILKEKN